MSQPVIFYSWQSDLPPDSTRHIIREAAGIAVSRVGSNMPIENSPRLDYDTLNQAGTPAITETIFHKIRHSAIFLADVTFVGDGKPRDGQKLKRLSNPNVLLELGYAAAAIGWDRIILVMNNHYGSPESLPFDLKFRRFPLTFSLGPNSNRRTETLETLARSLEGAIVTSLAAEYTRVDDALSKLTAFALSVIKRYGHQPHFFELPSEATIQSRVEMVILQFLDLGLIKTVSARNDVGCVYEWTYLGNQCARKLGVPNAPLVLPDLYIEPPRILVDASSYDALDRANPGDGVQTRFDDGGLTG